MCDIQAKSAPKTVKANDQSLQSCASQADFEKATEGYFFDAADRGGRLHVKTAKLSTNKDATNSYIIL